MTDNTDTTDYVEFKLSKPITTHQGKIDVLKLRPPTAGTFVKCGMPFSMINEGDGDSLRSEFRFYPDRMIRFISDMSGIDTVLLEAIAGNDVMPLFRSVVAILGNREVQKAGSE